MNENINFSDVVWIKTSKGKANLLVLGEAVVVVFVVVAVVDVVVVVGDSIINWIINGIIIF